MKHLLLLSLAVTLLIPQQRSGAFRLEETTIAQIHAAMKAGRLTCAALVDQYLARIEAHDKQGAALNAITVVNRDARKLATELDRRMKTSGLVGPLHCIPTIVKDNFETIGLQSAAARWPSRTSTPGVTPFQVKRSRRQARSSSPSRTWPSGPSAPTRRSTRCCPATRGIPTRSIA